MRLEITRTEGLRNDLLLRLDRAEIGAAFLSLPHRSRLMTLPGIPRHRLATADEARDLAASRIPIEQHLRGLGIVDSAGTMRQRAVAISNRNLGTNHGHLAWQRRETPRVFRVLEDPGNYPSYSCLSVRAGGRLAIEDLRFDHASDSIHETVSGRDVSDEIEWATFGQQVLRGGTVTRLENIADQFYDIRHVLAFEPHRPEGEAIRQQIYGDYPSMFRENVVRTWRDRGVPRARYFHNAIGLSDREVFILQRDGTIEEIGATLNDAGADDGLILDNGGSVACWVWWANAYSGGIVSPTVDYRPEGTSVIAFVLNGAAKHDVPGGSVGATVV